MKSFKGQLFACLAAIVLTPHAFYAQGVATPVILVLVRDDVVPYEGLSQPAQYGKLYRVRDAGLNKAQVQTEGKLIAQTLELPSRGNLTDSSNVPLGTYRGTAEKSTEYGWDIRFVVPNRPGILLHHGNYPLDTKGCILVGASRSQGQQPIIVPADKPKRDSNSGLGPLVPTVEKSDMTIKLLQEMVEASGTNEIVMVIE
jgi:hypothetical protein